MHVAAGVVAHEVDDLVDGDDVVGEGPAPAALDGGG